MSREQEPLEDSRKEEREKYLEKPEVGVALFNFSIILAPFFPLFWRHFFNANLRDCLLIPGVGKKGGAVGGAFGVGGVKKAGGAKGK